MSGETNMKYRRLRALARRGRGPCLPSDRRAASGVETSRLARPIRNGGAELGWRQDLDVRAERQNVEDGAFGRSEAEGGDEPTVAVRGHVALDAKWLKPAQDRGETA